MSNHSIQELFEKSAEKFAANTAIDTMDRCLSYAQLVRNANKLADCLISNGARKGTPIACLVEDTVNVVVAVIAIFKAGCVFVPLDHRLPRKRIEDMALQVHAEWFLTEPQFVKDIEEVVSKCHVNPKVISMSGRLHETSVPSSWTVLNGWDSACATTPSVTHDPDDMCYVFFTSGSTGRPKGIAGRLKSIRHFVEWEIATLALGEGTRVSQFTSPSFDAILRDLFVPLCSGGTICAPKDSDLLLDPQKLIHWIETKGINLIHCVPSLFRLLIGEKLLPEYFPELRHILMAGESLLPSDVKKWVGVFGPRIQLVNLYGPSETTMIKLFHFVKPEDKDRPSIPIGKSMPGAAALVVDGKGRACPSGIVGEIYIRTPYRSLGYFGDPELTKTVFVQNPFSQLPDDIVYKTGDLGRLLPDGNIEFLGRKDQQVKIRGIRIELSEVENVLRSHTAIKDVAVVDREDASGYKYLCAYLVQSAEIDSESLREFLAATLPDYMVPSAFIVLSAIPRGVNGKVDRKALPSPSQVHRDLAINYVEPRTPVEKILAGIWSEVLGIPRIGIHDNFFELGGHSLLAMQILTRVRAALDVEISLRSLFRATTVADLTAVVDKAQLLQADPESVAELIREIKELPPNRLEEQLEQETRESSIT